MNYMPIYDARRVRFELGFLFETYTEYLIYTYFVTSFLYMSLIININRYFINYRFDLSIIITIISAVLFGFTGLGRFIFFDSIVFFFLAIAFRKKYICLGKNDISNKKVNYDKVKYIFIAILGIVFMTVITGRRMGIIVTDLRGFYDLLIYSFQQGIIYFIGPFRAFDNFFHCKIYENIGYTYGRSAFAGLDEIFNNFAILMGTTFESANSKMASFTVDSILIGQGQWFNAFYTGVMNFYLDGRIGGVIILAFLYGSAAAVVWNHFQKCPQLFSYSLLIYFTYTTIASEFL